MKPLKQYACLLLLGLFFTFGCKKGKQQNKIQDEKQLQTIMVKIKALAESSKCTENQPLKFKAIGAKACGGPTGYIGYSTSIDTEELEKLVDQYTDLQKEFNKKWQITSDCMYLMPPKLIKCENGQPVLVYQN